MNARSYRACFPRCFDFLPERLAGGWASYGRASEARFVSEACLVAEAYPAPGVYPAPEVRLASEAYPAPEARLASKV